MEFKTFAPLQARKGAAVNVLFDNVETGSYNLAVLLRQNESLLEVADTWRTRFLVEWVAQLEQRLAREEPLEEVVIAQAQTIRYLRQLLTDALKHAQEDRAEPVNVDADIDAALANLPGVVNVSVEDNLPGSR